MPKTHSNASRFEAFLSNTVLANSGCLLWKSAMHRTDYFYGRFWMGRDLETVGGHCASWIFFYGSIPQGQWVLHKCDTPGCVNPLHLFLGNAMDNTTDMWSKGRHVRGEAVENAKLTDAIVIECRTRRKQGETFISLSREFGVCKSVMMNAIKGRQWKHIPLD